MNIKDLMRPNIVALAPYSTARDEYEGGEIGVFLDANESPFENGYNRYPDPHLITIKKKLSSIKNIATQNIFVGNGSDEAIDLIFRVFCTPGVDNSVAIAPSYGMYKVASATNDIEMHEVQLTENFELCASTILNACNAQTKVVWLCSPNNPSGNLLNKDEVIKIITTFKGIVVVDEAYIDFAAEGSSFLTSLNQYPNLIILQTLSKGWGMAGLRLGMAFGNEQIISVMNNIKYPYNINIAGQQKVSELLDKKDEIAAQIEEIKRQREVVLAKFAKIEGIEKIYSTSSNFVLIKVADATKLYNYLVSQGIIVRNRTSIKGCENCLRISIGTEDENQKLLKAIDSYEW